ncbi:MAG: hypothetical protein WC673_01865 [Candidatus Paceibacterota bacterium]|jgi:hypothetical protein
MNSEFVLTQGAGQKLEFAVNRNSGVTTDVDWLSAGENFKSVILLARGLAELVVKIKTIFRQLKTIPVSAIGAKPTTDCFTNQSRYYYRDGDLDRYLPKVQPDQPESKFAVCELTEASTFKQMVENILGVQGDINTLSKLLKEHGHTTTLPTIEALIERQENGEDVGLLTNGYANFFFVENEDGSVSVVAVDRGGGQWDVYQRSLGRGHRWFAVYRFFLRNFPRTL